MDLVWIIGATKEIEVWLQNPDHSFVKSVLGYLPSGTQETSLNLVDLNNDGLLDIYVTNGSGNDLLYINTSGLYAMSLVRIPLTNIPETAGNSLCSTVVDANNDGAMDVYVACSDGPNFLLVNQFFDLGNWVEFDLSSISQNAGALGSRVLLVNNNSILNSGELFGGNGPVQNSSVVHFGMGQLNNLSSAIVFWGGESTPTVLHDLPVNQLHCLVEPESIILPTVSETAEYSVLSGGGNNSIFAVKVENNGSTSMLVTAELTAIGGGSDVLLVDNGVDPDSKAGDWVFTAPPFSSNVISGQYNINVTAQGTLGLPALQSVAVEVIESTILLKDGSEDTGDLAQLSGSPYSGIYFDTDIDGLHRNVMVVTKDTGDSPEIFLQGNVVDGAPDMGNRTVLWFGPGEAPASGSRGTYAADFDNDGFEDFFVCNNGSATRLYRNTSTGFVDETTIWFGANAYLLEGAHVAAWGDYNQDSRLDLFVATSDYTGSIAALTSDPNLANSMGWYLFENRGSSFELTSGTMTYSGGVTLSASWNDVNSDGLLDLVVGEFSSTPGDGPTVLMNQGYKKLSGHFVLSEDPLLSHVPGLNVNSLDWIDYNHDSLPDLVVTEFSPNTGAKILVNTATGFDVAVTLNGDRAWSGAVVADYNLDGQDDVTLLPDTDMPALYIGDPGNISSYQELAYPLGMREGATSGGFAADFNDDKDMDLYLGRANTDEFLYKNRRVDNEENPVVGQQNWVRFNLLTLGNCNSSLIGTRLTLSDGVRQWHQTVDGGSGRGGQRSNELHFGVGNSSGPFTATVNWPVSSSDVFSGLGVNTVFTLPDLAVPTINGTSLSFSHEPYPGGADWVFTWTTNERGSEELDEVELDFGSYAPLDYCYRGPNTTLSWADPNVSITIVPGALGDWNHTVVWSGQPCLGAQVCGYQFRVRSSVGSQTAQESGWASFGEFDVCITKKNIQQN